VQPSELAKVALVLALARYFQRYPPSQTTRLRELVRPGRSSRCRSADPRQHDMGVALLTL
jgi:cell division protein FtsW (lipid II flippase)